MRYQVLDFRCRVDDSSTIHPLGSRSYLQVSTNTAAKYLSIVTMQHTQSSRACATDKRCFGAGIVCEPFCWPTRAFCRSRSASYPAGRCCYSPFCRECSCALLPQRRQMPVEESGTVRHSMRGVWAPGPALRLLGPPKRIAQGEKASIGWVAEHESHCAQPKQSKHKNVFVWF